MRRVSRVGYKLTESTPSPAPVDRKNMRDVEDQLIVGGLSHEGGRKARR
jgi:hypothetical protein